ncbi:BZ3500_MvSof-1268-A1-R1_Chr8-2g10104 [Microbotryum saponariae]|uniref:BZ3500_MvSof-1268-A1-R1_Chr8-2g10104 protein n=1 Tax=Microbotryum saponariae TaxID=289078 RepID=A0A2X0LJM0_9BASI|nr:BZ3500_MvSof-1268-A1-R1_Chr8-2g10104 [Microbotryum saponariae]SDA01794.1 BZ3501_MvSof-1269-A2-R1_Chr8-2g09855 [Microbotryum saponariae]
MSSKATNKVVNYYGKRDIRVEEILMPVPGEGQVLIKLAWCGICGTDLHEYTGKSNGPILCPTADTAHGITGEKLPICLGHEFSGVISQVGPGVKGEWKKGDRVIVEPTISCFKCYACKHNFRNACSSLGFVGLSGYGGGLAEYTVAGEGFLHKLPDNVSLQHGAMVEPLAVGMHAVERSGAAPGCTALVCGAGPIGCFVTKVLIAMGASKVIVSEPSGSRRKMATHAGAHHVISPREDDVVSKCRELTGGDDVGVDVSFECAGVEASLTAAIAALRPRGTCVNVAIWSTKPQIDMNALVLGEKTLRAVICYESNHKPAIESLSSGKISLDGQYLTLPTWASPVLTCFENTCPSRGFVTGTASLDDIVEKGFHELINNNEQREFIYLRPRTQMVASY